MGGSRRRLQPPCVPPTSDTVWVSGDFKGSQGHIWVSPAPRASPQHRGGGGGRRGVTTPSRGGPMRPSWSMQRVLRWGRVPAVPGRVLRGRGGPHGHEGEGRCDTPSPNPLTPPGPPSSSSSSVKATLWSPSLSSPGGTRDGVTTVGVGTLPEGEGGVKVQAPPPRSHPCSPRSLEFKMRGGWEIGGQ